MSTPIFVRLEFLGFSDTMHASYPFCALATIMFRVEASFTIVTYFPISWWDPFFEGCKLRSWQEDIGARRCTMVPWWLLYNTWATLLSRGPSFSPLIPCTFAVAVLSTNKSFLSIFCGRVVDRRLDEVTEQSIWPLLFVLAAVKLLAGCPKTFTVSWACSLSRPGVCWHL